MTDTTTPRTDAATAAQSSAYLMFQEVVRVSRELERELAEAKRALSDTPSKWVPVGERVPAEKGDQWTKSAPLYVLAVDGKGRMSVGYCIAGYYKDGGAHWVFAKAIGAPTHWMPLPEVPK